MPERDKNDGPARRVTTRETEERGREESLERVVRAVGWGRMWMEERRKAWAREIQLRLQDNRESRNAPQRPEREGERKRLADSHLEARSLTKRKSWRTPTNPGTLLPRDHS
jgi:hypothetical protein